MADLEKLTAPAIAVAEPGDTLIISFAEMLTEEQARFVTEKIREIAPTLNSLVFQNGARIVINRAGEK